MEYLLASGYYFLVRMLKYMWLKSGPAAGSAILRRSGHRVNRHKNARAQNAPLGTDMFPMLERFLALQPKYKQPFPRLVYDSFDEFD
jgi:hypothetical protein